MNAQMFAELKDAFASHDANHDGSLDRREFTALLEHLGTHMTEAQIEMGFQMVDEDESGRISFDELEKWWEIVRDG